MGSFVYCGSYTLSSFLTQSQLDERGGSGVGSNVDHAYGFSGMPPSSHAPREEFLSGLINALACAGFITLGAEDSFSYASVCSCRTVKIVRSVILLCPAKLDIQCSTQPERET